MFTLTRCAKLKSQNKRNENIKETFRYGRDITGQFLYLIGRPLKH